MSFAKNGGIDYQHEIESSLVSGLYWQSDAVILLAKLLRKNKRKAKRRAIAMDKNSVEYEALVAIDRWPLDTNLLAYTISKTPTETVEIVARLFEAGLIDRLKSHPIFFAFPGLRGKKYKSTPPSLEEDLTTTMKGYFVVRGRDNRNA